MTAFDEAWWDARTRRHGRFDTNGVPTEGAVHVAWMRWRLVDELLRRYYTDFGLEPGFGLLGVELYQVALFSPTCQRAPRYFGRLCGTGLHPEREGDAFTDSLGLTWAGLATDSSHEGTWPTWSDYRHHAIRALGLDDAGVTGHEGCFHRRGKALTPLTYRVALLLRTDGGHHLDGLDAMVTVTSEPGDSQHRSAVVDVITRAGRTVPHGPPRFLGVSTQAGWIALCTDGWVATPAGPVDAAGLWRRGADEEEIAGAIHEQWHD